MFDDRALLEAARAHAVLTSSHPTKKVGAVLMPKSHLHPLKGSNRLPPGVQADRDRPLDLFVEHAERDVLMQAARLGIGTSGATMYLNWYPCADCARAMVGAGIKRLVSSRRPDFGDPKWGKHFTAASQILAEGGVTTEYQAHA